MPTSQLIRQICTASSDCDFNSSPLDLGLIGMPYTFIHWYHDVNYSADEYGCTTLPNIFHTALIDRQGNIVWIEQCTSRWGWTEVKSLWFDGSKWYVVYAGARYVSGSAGYHFVQVIDISNPAAPVIVKTIEETVQRSTHLSAYVNLLNGKVIFASGGAGSFITDMNTILNATNLDQVKQTAISMGSRATPLGADRILVPVTETSFEIRDYSGTLITSGTTPVSMGFLLTPVFKGTTPALFGWRFDQTQAVIIDYNGLVSTKPTPAYTGTLWHVGTASTGLKVIYGVGPAQRILVYDGLTDTVTTDIISDCPVVSTGKPEDMVCIENISGYGKYSKFIPDTYLKVVTTGSTVRITDPAGNPQANKTVYFFKVSFLTNRFVGIDNSYVTGTTDSDGYVTIPAGLSGVIAIAVP